MWKGAVVLYFSYDRMNPWDDEFYSIFTDPHDIVSLIFVGINVDKLIGG